MQKMIFKRSTNLKSGCGMSIEKSTKAVTPQKIIKQQNLSQVVHNTYTQRVHYVAQQGDASDPSDLTLLTKYVVKARNINSKRFLVFRNSQYIVSNWTHDYFPVVMYIKCDGFVGYFGQNGTATERVASLQLSQIQAVLDQSQNRTYQLKYVLRDPVTWQIPGSPSIPVDLKFRLMAEDNIQQINPPLVNPFIISFEIKYCN